MHHPFSSPRSIPHRISFQTARFSLENVKKAFSERDTDIKRGQHEHRSVPISFSFNRSN